ncbi:MAG: PQQ-binding-like beta-propeller repeat protein [Phycisphaeraceae bacterium]|nr:PQQ-binding-like beta-propeller repeat protein [Phycisphaeraceae bacterium]
MTSLTRGEDWPNFRGPNFDGISVETNWNSDSVSAEHIAWTINVGIGYSAVSVVGDRAYTAGWKEGKDVLVALDVKTGETVWEYAFPMERFNSLHEGGPGATPTVMDQMVYLVSRDGLLNAVHAASGKSAWSRQLAGEFGVHKPSWAFAGSITPVGDDAMLIDMGKILMLNRKDGSAVWQSKDFRASYSTPVPFALNNRELVAAFPTSGLAILDRKTGKDLALYPWKGGPDVNAVTPIIDGDQLFISSGYNTGCAKLQLTHEGLREVWKNKNMRNHMATCILFKDHLYGFDEGQLKCLSFADGSVKWTQRNYGKGTLTASRDGRLIVLSDRGELVIAPADPAGFNPVAKVQAVKDTNCWIVPVLANGRIYCRAPNGQLACVDVAK